MRQLRMFKSKTMRLRKLKMKTVTKVAMTSGLLFVLAVFFAAPAWATVIWTGAVQPDLGRVRLRYPRRQHRERAIYD